MMTLRAPRILLRFDILANSSAFSLSLSLSLSSLSSNGKGEKREPRNSISRNFFTQDPSSVLQKKIIGAANKMLFYVILFTALKRRYA